MLAHGQSLPPHGSPHSCPYCSRVRHLPERFCAACGAWLNDPEVEGWALLAPPPSNELPAVCPRCGYPGARGAPFCANCGLRIAPLIGNPAKPKAGPTGSTLWSRGIIPVMLVAQAVLLGLGWALFEYDHTVTGRIFVGGFLLAGAANVAKGLSLLSARRRSRGPRK